MYYYVQQKNLLLSNVQIRRNIPLSLGGMICVLLLLKHVIFIFISSEPFSLSRDDFVSYEKARAAKVKGLIKPKKLPEIMF